ncbi:MAG TPA: hypothetical protein VFY40_07975 [Blastocatellia bacterium]|nr:hypothetical protein [Blastocatellia bacterium]
MLSLKTLFRIVTAGSISFSLLGISANAQAIKQEKKMNENVASESPIACNLNALDREQRRRHQSLTEQLRAAAQETRELTDGYSFRLPSDEATIQKTAEWITMERRCCPFIAFGIEVGREGGPLWLSLTGREGVKAFLKTEFDLK